MAWIKTPEEALKRGGDFYNQIMITWSDATDLFYAELCDDGLCIIADASGETIEDALANLRIEIAHGRSIEGE